MEFAGPNYLAVVLAAVAGFMLGWVWYGMLFKEQWLAAIGKSDAQARAEGGDPAQLAITFVALLLMALMLAGVLGHLGAAKITLKNGLITGTSCWLGFVITTMVVNHGFQGVKRSLTWIDGGHWLAVLLLQGAILGLLGTG